MVETRRSSQPSTSHKRCNKNKTTGPSKKPVSTIPKGDSDAPSDSERVAEFVNQRGRKITINGPSCPPQMAKNHDPVHQPATVIGKKRRKQYSSLQEAAYKEKVEQGLDVMTNSDIFSCNIDRMSEAQIVDAVDRINYSIDNMVSNIIYRIQKSKLSYAYYKPPSSKRRPTKLDSIIPTDLARSLENPQLSDNTRGLVVEALLHDLVCSLLNRTFFTGKHFFGVGCKPLHDYLETMFSSLVESENSDPIATQRWRSMSVEAVFKMNDGVVSQLNDRLRKELRRLLNRIVLPVGPPGRSNSKPICESIVCEEEQSLLDIICQARQLSFVMQHEIVSCQLLVTIAPMQASSNATTSSSDAVAGYNGFDKAVVSSLRKDMGPQDGEKVFGTYSFGLRRISASGCDILIQPRVTSTALLQSP